MDKITFLFNEQPKLTHNNSRKFGNWSIQKTILQTDFLRGVEASGDEFLPLVGPEVGASIKIAERMERQRKGEHFDHCF